MAPRTKPRTAVPKFTASRLLKPQARPGLPTVSQLNKDRRKVVYGRTTAAEGRARSGLDFVRRTKRAGKQVYMGTKRMTGY